MTSFAAKIIWFNTVALFGYVEHQVHKNNQQSIPELEDDIIRVITEITPQIFQNDIENFNKRGGSEGGGN